MKHAEEALKVAKDYINLLKSEKKELLQFRQILEDENKKRLDEVRKLKLRLALLEDDLKSAKDALKMKEKMTPGEKLKFRLDEEKARLTKKLKECRDENAALKRDKDILLQKIHLKEDYNQ